MAAETKIVEDATKAAEASGGLPQLDFSTWSSQIFWLVISFGLLYLVLWRIILPRIGAGISERGDRIADDLDVASQMQKEAEEASIAYERVLANAKAKAHNIAETTRKSVDADIAAEVETAEASFAKKQVVADERIRDIRREALSNIDNVAKDAISAILAKFGNVKTTAAETNSAISKLKS
ncbi:MAG: F0F1 ATP synthase subunit B' [Hellea sp.]|nr:F0F1 ATP synthase subunit B' [Hellea sp.]